MGLQILCRDSYMRFNEGREEWSSFLLTSDLWELLVQQPEVLMEGILSIILGNLIRLAQEEVLPIPFGLVGNVVIHGPDDLIQTHTCSFMTSSRSGLTLRPLIFSNI